MSDDESEKGKSKSASAGASVGGAGFGGTEAESFSGSDIARMLAVLSSQMTEQSERLGRLEREGRAEPKARGAAKKPAGRVSLSRPYFHTRHRKVARLPPHDKRVEEGPGPGEAGKGQGEEPGPCSVRG